MFGFLTPFKMAKLCHYQHMQCALAFDTVMCPLYSKSLPEALIHTQYESAKVKNVQVYASLPHSAQNFIFESLKLRPLRYRQISRIAKIIIN